MIGMEEGSTAQALPFFTSEGIGEKSRQSYPELLLPEGIGEKSGQSYPELPLPEGIGEKSRQSYPESLLECIEAEPCVGRENLVYNRYIYIKWKICYAFNEI